MVCVLNEAQQKAFLKKVAKDLYSMSQDDKSFNLKDYITSIYNRVKDKTGNEALAQTYAALVPSKIGLSRQFNKDIKKLVPNVQELESVEELLENFDNVSDYLGVAQVKKIEPEVNEVEAAKNAFDLANPSQVTVSTFSAKPNSLFTTTGNEDDPDLVFSYAFLRNFIIKNESNISSDSNGYYITMSSADRVLDEDSVSDKEILLGNINYLSDNEGNPFYFDENFKKTKKGKGKIVFFKVRENESSLQSVEERMKTLNLSEEEVNKTIRVQKKLIKAQKDYISADKKNNFIVNEISFIGKGFILENNSTDTNLKDHASFFENATISVEP